MTHRLLLLLLFFTNLVVATPQFHPTIQRAVDLACSGNFDEALREFRNSLVENLNDNQIANILAQSEHSIGNLLVLKGDILLAAGLHTSAKERDATALPPLALVFQNKHPCIGEFADLFWTSTFIKKAVADGGFGEQGDGSEDRDIEQIIAKYEKLTQTQKEKLLQSHLSLSTQLEDSGFGEVS